MLIFRRINKRSKSNIYMKMVANLFHRNIQAIKSFWLIIFLGQIPIFIIYLISLSQNPYPQTPLPDKRSLELSKKQDIQIKNLEKKFEELKKRFLALQIQHTKLLKSSILMSTKDQHDNSLSAHDSKKMILETIDRIGEKIRLNESFSNLLASLPEKCSSFSGYQILQQFSSVPPPSIYQLQKSFEDIRKKHVQPKKPNDLPKWLNKVAAIFRGKIKVEKIQPIDEEPFELIAEALEGRDLKTAHSFSKNIPLQQIQIWANHLNRRLELEDAFLDFSATAQQWVKQASTEVSASDKKDAFQ